MPKTKNQSDALKGNRTPLSKRAPGSVSDKFMAAQNRLETGEDFGGEKLSRSPIAVKCPEILTKAIMALPSKERNVWLRRVLLEAARKHPDIKLPEGYGWDAPA